MSLSRRITSEKELRDLGTIAFKLDDYVIDNALHQERPSIQDAARKVIQTWVNMQVEIRSRTYVKLLAVLEQCQMNQLAAQLRGLVEGTEDAAESKEYSSLVAPRLLCYSLIL